MMNERRPVAERKFLLNSGHMMPAVGLSTYRSRSEPVVYNVVDNALAAGYRLFDTSPLYCNESSLRYAFANLLPKYNLERSDIFIVSKLTVDSDDYSTIKSGLEETLANLGLDYIDLYLVSSSVHCPLNLKNAWEALQTLHGEGYTSSIGVANFKVEQLREIIEDYAVPSVNQVEWHPLRSNAELYNFCNEHNIQLQAYSPLGTPFAHHKRLFENRIIKKLAAKYEVPAAQIILMWSLQQGVAVLPSSNDPVHLKQNINIELELLRQDMHRVSSLAPDPDDSDADS